MVKLPITFLALWVFFFLLWKRVNTKLCWRVFDCVYFNAFCFLIVTNLVVGDANSFEDGIANGNNVGLRRGLREVAKGPIVRNPRRWLDDDVVDSVGADVELEVAEEFELYIHNLFLVHFRIIVSCLQVLWKKKYIYYIVLFIKEHRN